MRPRRRDPQRAGSVGQVERSTRYRNLANPFAPVRIFSDDQVENMHLAALGILERQGMRVLSPRGRAVLAGAGASVGEASPMEIGRAAWRGRVEISGVAGSFKKKKINCR